LPARIIFLEGGSQIPRVGCDGGKYTDGSDLEQIMHVKKARDNPTGCAAWHTAARRQMPTTASATLTQTKSFPSSSQDEIDQQGEAICQVNTAEARRSNLRLPPEAPTTERQNDRHGQRNSICNHAPMMPLLKYNTRTVWPSVSRRRRKKMRGRFLVLYFSSASSAAWCRCCLRWPCPIILAARSSALRREPQVDRRFACDRQDRFTLYLFHSCDDAGRLVLGKCRAGVVAILTPGSGIANARISGLSRLFSCIFCQVAAVR